MTIITNNLPIIIDFLCVVFLGLSLKSGYSGGIKYVMESFGTFLCIGLAAMASRILSEFADPIVELLAFSLSKTGIEESVLMIVFSIVIVFALFVLFFILLKLMWNAISKKLETKTNKYKGMKRDKIIGVVVEELFAIAFIMFLGLVMWKWTGVVSSEQMAESIIYSRLLGFIL